MAKLRSVVPFEVGPIRPPNEAQSLLVRVTRNCPWNHCTFCPVYKGERFSLRSVDEVKADIDAMAKLDLRSRTVFLQDANSLIVPVDDLVAVLEHLRRRFPDVERVTTYARAHTVLKRSVAELERLRTAGLDRIHIGLESGSDAVLALVKKGVTAAKHIEAGQRVRAAGIELSEYVMPGLGGRALSAEHAAETARVLRAIDPDFIRLRTLAIPPGSPIAEQREHGEIVPLDELGVVRELRALIAGLEGVSSVVKSDHMLNLLDEVEGKLPGDLPRMLAAIDRFCELSPDEREVFVVGRRLGLLRRLDALDDPMSSGQARAVREVLAQRYPGRVETALRELIAGAL